MNTEEMSNAFVVVNDEAETLNISVEKKEESAPSTEKKPESKSEKTDEKAGEKDKPEGKAQEGKKPEGESKDEGKKEGDKDTPDADDASGKRHQRRFEKRIGRLTKRAGLAEERASSAEERAAKAERELAEIKSQSSKPKPEDFDTHKEFETALEKWTEKKPKPSSEAKKPAANSDFVEALAEVSDSFEDGRKAHEDFDELVLAKDTRITEPMIIAMADADDPSEIAYYLGKHKSETARIAELSPLRQAKEIAKIELKLTAQDKDKDKTPEKENKTEAKAPGKKVSQAPAPLNPLSGNDASEKKLEDMDFAEFEQERKRKSASKSFW